MRSKPLLNLLRSVAKQTLYPNEILIIDGSTDQETETVLKENHFKNLNYYSVDETHRGLTKQRNFGIGLANETSEIICFLDDDTELYEDYFENVIDTFKRFPNCVGVGGVAVNENRWFKPENEEHLKNHYILEGYAVKESSRNVMRTKFGLQSPALPGIMSNFSHGRTYGYPLNGKIHEVDLLVGMAFSFKKELFESIEFSHYFEGYGLYEDADFSLRALNYGVNVINTNAKLNHYHNPSGRPNQYKYGKMVLRNGWYVWRVKYPNPSLKARFKWHATAFLLTLIRFTNVINTNKKQEAFTESLGRVVGWLSLLINKPNIER
tara:strand:- start:115528 stop:116493 length:966 start_codon:yes stop_codon:yes gene_type:complete